MKNSIITIITALMICGIQPQLEAKELKSISHEHNSTEANYKNKKNKINQQNNRNFYNGKLTSDSSKKRSDHAAKNGRNGIKLSKELSRNKCRGNWGYDYYGVWVVNGCRARFTTDRYQSHWGNGYNKDDIIRCESYRSGKKTCPIKRNFKNVKVKLVHQLSAKSCRNNWGHNNRDIWVNNGCKADFRVETKSLRPNHAQGQSSNELTCFSKEYRKKYCDIPRLRDVKLIEVLSKTKRNCNQNNWGYDNRGIWVDNNCKARFRYTQKGGNSGGWQGNNHNDNSIHERPGDSRTLKCKSRSRGKKICATNVRKANLIRAISKGKYPCKGNWGIDRRGDLYVKNNCYAEFKVWD